MGVILGNALGNAVETLQVLPYEDRYLTIAIELSLEILTIEIENSYDKDYKKEGPFRGTGLKSINKLAKEYGGFLETSPGEKYRIFISLMNR